MERRLGKDRRDFRQKVEQNNREKKTKTHTERDSVKRKNAQSKKNQSKAKPLDVRWLLHAVLLDPLHVRLAHVAAVRLYQLDALQHLARQRVLHLEHLRHVGVLALLLFDVTGQCRALEEEEIKRKQKKETKEEKAEETEKRDLANAGRQTHAHKERERDKGRQRERLRKA